MNQDTEKMLLFFRDTFVHFEAAIFVMNIFDLIALVTFKK